jgi:hypothetical protein
MISAGPGGATRLIPASVPLRFFLAASLFHVAAWLALAYAAEDAGGFVGGTGPPLAALHFITLGVLTTVAMGATFQLIPVATRLPAGPVWPAQLIFLLHVSGATVLIAGMGLGAARLMAVGGIVCGSGLLAFGVAAATVLRRATKLNLLVVHLWCSFAALAALTALGLALVFNAEHGFLADHARVGMAHMAIAVYGFMGLLVLGLSHVLLPMFALAPAPSPQHGRTNLALTALALVLGATGVLTQIQDLLAAGLLIGLVGAGAHIATLESSLRRRMRKQLGTPFLLVRVGHACLVLNLLAGVLLAMKVPLLNGAALFVWTAVAGWLLTFMLGILQKIVPFLVSMHLAQAKQPVPAAELGPRGALRVHTACHLLALVLVTAGLASDAPVLIRIGAVAGSIGAATFAWFAFAVASRVLPARADAPLQVAALDG